MTHLRIATSEEGTQEFERKYMEDVKHKLRSCLQENLLKNPRFLSSHGGRSENTHERRGTYFLHSIVESIVK